MVSGTRVEACTCTSSATWRSDAKGKPYELPATAAGPAGHQRRRPRGVAELPVDRRPHPSLARDEVDDQPVEAEAEVGDGAPHVPADGAAGAVAADGPAGPPSRRSPSGLAATSA